jgi:hypothetical protein
METIFALVALAVTLSCTAAIAKTPKQLKSERFERKAECLRQAKLRHFDRNFLGRNRFMRQCLARS